MISSSRYSIFVRHCLTFVLLVSIWGCQSGQVVTPSPEVAPSPLAITPLTDITVTVTPSLITPATEVAQEATTTAQTTSTQTVSFITHQPAPLEATQTFTPPSSCIDQAKAGRPIDVTIPDDTEMRPGQEFRKTWRLINDGTCTWTPDYAVVWFWGERMSESDVFPLGTTVAPGEEVEISVDLIAPQTPGTFQSNWKLRNPSGQIFGVGPGEGLYFYVRIRVVATPIPGSPGITATPEIALTPTEAVKASGPTRLLVRDRIDLDTNRLNPSEGSDIVLSSGGGQYFLLLLNNAKFSVFGKQQPTLEDCRQASLNTNSIYVDEQSSGLYLCYRTSAGLPGWLLLTRFWPDRATLNLEFLTWAMP